MRYQIAICDDEPEQAQRLREHVAAWNKDCKIALFSSAEAFWFAYAGDNRYDILLLDVEMKALSGIDLAKRLRAQGSRMEIIFITSHFELIGEGYEVDALHYLIKPVAEKTLFAVLDRAAEKLAVEPPFLVFFCEGETVKLYEADILYVESFLHDLVLYTKAKSYRIRESISALAQKLSEDFFRAHRSYLINLKYVTRIGRKTVTLSDTTELPLARGKYDELNRAFIARN